MTATKIKLKVTSGPTFRARVRPGLVGPQGPQGEQGEDGIPGGSVADANYGEITVSGSGTNWTINADAVTYAKLQNISATARFLGRITAGAGNAEELNGTQATTLIDAVVGDFGSGGTKGLVPAPGAGDAAAGKFLKADGTFAVPPGAGGLSDGDKGDVVVSGSGTIWTIDSGVVTLAKLANIATDSLIGRDTAMTGVPESISVSGGIEFTGSGAIQVGAFTGDVTKSAGTSSLTIAADAVTYPKIQNVSATARFLGRITAGAGDIEELTGTQATTLLDPFTDALDGLAPASGGGSTNFLRADGTWATPSATVGDGDKGDVTVSSGVWTIDATVVTYAKIQNVSDTDKVLGRSTAGAGSIEEIPCTSAGRSMIGASDATAQTALLDDFVGDSGSGGTAGLVPAPSAGDAAADKFLKANGTFATPSVSAALSATDRQNFALSAIYQAKTFGAYRRMVNFFADGYKGTGGVAAGSSSNYSVNTINGRVEPTISGTDVLVLDENGTSALSGSSFFTRQAALVNSVDVYTVGIYSTTAGTIVLKIIERHSASDNDVVYSESVSHDGGGWQDFVLATPYSVPASGSFYLGLYTASSMNIGLQSAPRSVYTGEATGSGLSMTEATANTPAFRYTHTATTDNMTVVTTAQTVDSSVSTARALIEFNPVDSITLNTDLTIDLTCDGGSNWTGATLSLVTANSQAGRTVAETGEESCTAGTSVQARIKNLNNKDLQVYGTTVQVS